MDELVKRLRNRRICIQQSGSLDDFPLLREAADAIEKLTAYVALYKDGGETAMKVANDYKARIEELQKQLREEKVDNVNLTGWLAEEHAKHLWIPVKERLPAGRTRCVTISEDGDYGLGLYTAEFGWMFPYYMGKVSHWMPLPAPPKEET